VGPSDSILLDIRGLSKTYGDRAVVSDVSFAVDRGERLAIMGPSGSGKTTLVNCIGGIEVPSAGSITFDGERLTDENAQQLSRLRRKEITSVFQFFHLLPHLSLHENVELPLIVLGVGRRERQERVRQLLEEAGIAGRAHAFPAQCSGGEMQRAAIARALIVEPKLILADEPTGNLDSENGERILDLIEALSSRHGTAVILVTHAQSATRICQRIIRFRDGEIESDRPFRPAGQSEPVRP
jgi:ABC-type lipoprotein export system ATPase subunit